VIAAFPCRALQRWACRTTARPRTCTGTGRQGGGQPPRGRRRVRRVAGPAAACSGTPARSPGRRAQPVAAVAAARGLDASAPWGAPPARACIAFRATELNHQRAGPDRRAGWSWAGPVGPARRSNPRAPSVRSQGPDAPAVDGLRCSRLSASVRSKVGEQGWRTTLLSTPSSPPRAESPHVGAAEPARRSRPSASGLDHCRAPVRIAAVEQDRGKPVRHRRRPTSGSGLDRARWAPSTWRPARDLDTISPSTPASKPRGGRRRRGASTPP